MGVMNALAITFIFDIDNLLYRYALPRSRRTKFEADFASRLSVCRNAVKLKPKTVEATASHLFGLKSIAMITFYLTNRRTASVYRGATFVKLMVNTALPEDTFCNIVTLASMCLVYIGVSLVQAWAWRKQARDSSQSQSVFWSSIYTLGRGCVLVFVGLLSDSCVIWAYSFVTGFFVAYDDGPWIHCFNQTQVGGGGDASHAIFFPHNRYQSHRR